MTGKDRQVILCKDPLRSKPRCYICDGRLAIFVSRTSLLNDPTQSFHRHQLIDTPPIVNLSGLPSLPRISAYRGSRLPAHLGFPRISASADVVASSDFARCSYLGNDHGMTQVRAQTKERRALRSVLQEDRCPVSRAELVARNRQRLRQYGVTEIKKTTPL